MGSERNFCPEAPTISEIIGRPLTKQTIMSEAEWIAVYERLSAHVQSCFNYPCTERRRGRFGVEAKTIKN